MNYVNPQNITVTDVIGREFPLIKCMWLSNHHGNPTALIFPDGEAVPLENDASLTFKDSLTGSNIDFDNVDWG